MRYRSGLRLPRFTKSLQNHVGVYADGLPKEEECGTTNEHRMVQPALVILLEVRQPPPLHVAIKRTEHGSKEDGVERGRSSFHIQWVDQCPIRSNAINCGNEVMQTHTPFV